MSDPVTAGGRPPIVESVTALGLMLLGLAAIGIAVGALASGLPVGDLAAWVLLIPLWGLAAVPLGWMLRHRSAPARLRAIGRGWLLIGLAPILYVMAVGRPTQKAMLDAEKAGETGR